MAPDSGGGGGDSFSSSAAGGQKKKSSGRRQKNSFQRLWTRLKDRWERLNASNNALFILSERNRFRRLVQRIVFHKYYDKVVLFLILANCAFLAMFDPRLPPDHAWNGVLDLSELVFTVIFTVEFVLQIVARNFIFGREAYLSNPWNWLDFMIVVTGLLAYANLGGNLTGLRTFRALKPLKTINGVPGMRMLVTTLLESIPMIGDVFLLIVWLFLIFGIVGVNEFAGSLRSRCFHDDRVDDNGNALIVHATRNVPCKVGTCPAMQTCVSTGENPNYGFTSFDDISDASLIIFQVITMQGWSAYIFTPVVAGNGPVTATVFFVSLVAFGGVFATALLTSVVTAKYMQLSKLEAIKGVQEDSKAQGALFNRLMRYTVLKSIYEFDTRERRWQTKLQAIVMSKQMENLILACIGANVLVMAADYPGMDKGVAGIFTWLNFGFSVVFAMEFSLKLPAFGLIKYCSDSFNLLDGLVVTLWLVEMALTAGPFGDGGSSQFSGLRTFRLLRVLRSMKVLRSNRGLKKLMETISHGLASLGSFMAVLTMFIFIFTLLGMQLFGGPDDTTSLPRRNFNTLFNSFVSVFEMLTGTNWYLLLWAGMRSKGSVLGIYFIFWLILGHFILLKLFFAIIVQNFGQETDDERAQRQQEERDRIEYQKSIAHSELVGERITRRRHNRLALEVDRLRTFLKDVEMYDEVDDDGDGIGDDDIPLAPGEVRDSDDDADDGQSEMSNLPFQGSRESLKTKKAIPTVNVKPDEGYSPSKAQYGGLTGNEERFGPWTITGDGPLTGVSETGVWAGGGGGGGPGPVMEAYGGGFGGAGAGARDAAVAAASAAATTTTTTTGGEKENANASGASGTTLVHRQRTNFQKLQSRVHKQLRSDAKGGGTTFGMAPPNQRRDSFDTTSKPRAATHAKMLVAKLLDPENANSGGVGAGAAGAGGSSVLQNAMHKEEQKLLARHVNVGEVPGLAKHLKSTDTLKALVEQTKDPSGRRDVQLSPTGKFASAVRQMSGRNLGGVGDGATMFQKVFRNLRHKIREKVQDQVQLRPICEDETILDMEPNDLVVPPTLLTARSKALEKGVPVDTVYISVLKDKWTRKEKEKPEIITLEAKPDNPSFLEHRSLFLFSPKSTLRRVLYLVVTDQWFEWMLISAIFLSSISLALDKPSLHPDDPVKRVVDLSDVVFNVVFFYEFLMKVIAMGFVMHPGAYLRSAWNMVDFLIMLTSTMSMATNSPEFKIFRSFRLLRALRPLRMIRRLRGMQVVVVALIRSMPTTVNVLTFGCFLFFIFGVLGVQMFGLTFYRCNDPDVSGKDACVGMFVPPNVTEALANMGKELRIGSSIDVLSTNVTTATTTVLMRSDNVTTANTSTTTTTTVALAATTAAPQMISRIWKNRAYNFDNLWNAMISLFVVATMDNWLDIAFDAVDATGIDSQPSTGTQPVMFLFFVAWIIMGSLFFFNLLVGVVVDQYLRIQAETGELVLRTEEQKHWAEAIKTKKYQSSQSETTVDVPDNFIQKAMFQVLFSTRFDVFIMLCIVLNVLLMASYHHNQAAIFTEAQTSLGFIFSMVFLFEAILKLLACGPSRYWRDPWNRFDAIIVLFGLPSMLGLNIGLGPSVFRIFRVGRLFKLLKGARGLRALFNTFLDALPALGNVGSLLFLLMFTYAVLGMNLYADLPRDDVITTNNNFSDFSASLLVLFRVFTKDAWSEVMEACYKCHELESDCGIQVTAPFFFMSFIIMASYIMLYLVIATMLFYFSENATNESLLSATSFFDALQRKMMLDKFMGKLTKKLGKHKMKMSKLGKRTAGGR